MEILRLSTKKNTLDALREGRLRDYAREIRPNTMKKYCELDEEGFVVDVDGVLQPRKYDVVQFQCGHEACAFKIEDAQIELFEDESGELITYIENDEEYIAAQVVYSLGERILL